MFNYFGKIALVYGSNHEDDFGETLSSIKTAISPFGIWMNLRHSYKREEDNKQSGWRCRFKVTESFQPNFAFLKGTSEWSRECPRKAFDGT